MAVRGSWRVTRQIWRVILHEPAQPPIESVTMKKNLLYVNGKPWMPWGMIYGHNPVYDGLADPGKYLDLHNLSDWNMYDGFVYHTNSRANTVERPGEPRHFRPDSAHRPHPRTMQAAEPGHGGDSRPLLSGSTKRGRSLKTSSTSQRGSLAGGRSF